MLKKKTTLLIILTFLITSCGNTWDSVKRGLTGTKQKSTDEFLIKKKDPLILPPDFESLPSPSDSGDIAEEITSIEKTLKKTSEAETTFTSTGSSAEDSILKQIRRK